LRAALELARAVGVRGAGARERDELQGTGSRCRVDRRAFAALVLIEAARSAASVQAARTLRPTASRLGAVQFLCLLRASSLVDHYVGTQLDARYALGRSVLQCATLPAVAALSGSIT